MTPLIESIQGQLLALVERTQARIESMPELDRTQLAHEAEETKTAEQWSRRTAGYMVAEILDAREP
jgi:hypothetical protein